MKAASIFRIWLYPLKYIFVHVLCVIFIRLMLARLIIAQREGVPGVVRAYGVCPHSEFWNGYLSATEHLIRFASRIGYSG